MVLLGARGLAEVGKGLEEQLKRRQPLLAVDDEPRFQAAGLFRLVLEYDRTEEVGAGWLIGQHPTGDGLDIGPERLPLLLLFPDIRPLIERHDVPPVLAEDRFQVECAGVHGDESIKMWVAGNG